MTFSHQIKLEVLNKKMKKTELVAFFNGFIYTSCDLNQNFFLIKINKKNISDLLKNKLDLLKIPYFQYPKNINWFTIQKKNIKLEKQIKNPRYFFAGAFLAGGNISNFDSTSYHLEIATINKHIANLMIEKLNQYDFNFHLITKKDKYVIYEKKSENILDFLNAIGAIENFKTFFDIKIFRDIKNSANRMASLDVYNQQKLVNASSQIIENFDFVIKNKLLHLFKDEEILFFKIKKESPFLNLNEIVELLATKHNIIKTKSALNHWNIKLKKIVKKNQVI
ncbi:DNA-binding protein WhiA [[Mycoplasma] collis]|uniref:DNA-binding protein WhiA n=1 Tax=[Mycoplasma] collis TaxID=2127 RepID=UPI00051C2AC6|nr:DNA-binding protein WhiA [[Mycoplasma] collis]